MPRLRRLPVRIPSKHVIVDGQLFPIDKEYAQLGEREGWLEVFKIITTKHESTYYYEYVE